jgi:hypothetical protein
MNKPQGVFVEAPDSEISILLKEAAKKRKQMPLRRLFDRIPNLVRRLKPCFLMSPISVSQFILPDRLHFDLVVFDEASQIFTEDAVGSIYRGDCLIVAGDNKQLPPTPFFQYIADSDDEWEEKNGDVGAFDSVLDECMGVGLPVSMLRWHYRSRHDSLISFSNSHFYDNKLVLFPSSIHRDSGLGVELVHVSDGVYDRGGTRSNEREAQVVADLVFKHFEQHQDKSLGVVTFSISQMNRVKDEIEARLISKPGFEKVLQEDRLRGFFVKNLENVQGDERDVMIISVGYGFDADGKLTMNFGPLNRVGGERRLNVAVTRAREKFIVVSSIRAGDIDVESTSSVGVHCLHDYLRYAEERVVAESRLRDREAVASIEEEVAEEVSRLGYLAVPRVGEGSLKVDIGVKKQEDGNRYLLGILLDGEYYQISPTSRDRDRLRAQVLESMGWSLHRVWSPEWVLKRSTELERLSEALRASESGKSVVGAVSDPVIKKSVEHSKVSERRGCDLPGVETYRRASLEPHQSFRNYDPKSKALYQKLYRLELKRLLPKLVKVEGPIHLDFAINRLNAAVELKPVPIGFRGIFEAVVEESVSKGRIEKVGDFLWPEGSRSVSVRVPGEGVDTVVRPIEYIPPEEIEAVMFHILGHSIGLSADTLVAETSKMFSARLTTKNEGIIRDELDRIIKEGKVEESFDGFLRMATDRRNTN